MMNAADRIEQEHKALYDALHTLVSICALADSEDGPADYVLDECRAVLQQVRDNPDSDVTVAAR